MRALLLLLALPLWATDDVNTILRHVVAADHRNEKNAQQYTYIQETIRFALDKDGQMRQTSTVTHEVIFVEGLKYEKLVAREGKPLTPKEQAKVDKDMSQTAAERRKRAHPTSPGGAVARTSPFNHKTTDLGSLSELLTLFDNRLIGEEEIRGHKTWVIESTPKKASEQMSMHEKDVLGFGKKFWVDQKDNMVVRAIHTVVEQGSAMRPGSTLTFEYEKIDADTWEPVTLTMDFSLAKQAIFKPTGRTVYTMHDFHKFDVQSTITVVGPGK